MSIANETEPALRFPAPLADIVSIKTTSSANEATMLIECGGVLLGVGVVYDSDGGEPFRYAIGWLKSKGAPPEDWLTCWSIT